MKEGIIKDTYELIIKELQTLLSIAYVSLVGIGMLFNYHKYEEFGINIFDYSDVFDFLIAPFSDGYIVLFAGVSLSFIALIIGLDSWWKKKRPKSYSRANFGLDKRPWFQLYRIIIFSLSIVLYLIVSADFYGRYTKRKVKEKSNIAIRFTDSEWKYGKLIGKTKDVLFCINREKYQLYP